MVSSLWWIWSRSKDFDSGCLCLSAQHVFQPDHPPSGSVVDRQRKELVTAAVRGEDVPRVVRHNLARRVHDFHVKDVAAGRRFFLQAQPQLSSLSALETLRSDNA